MRNRVFDLPRRLIGTDATFSSKADSESGGAYATRLDRLLEPTTEATLEEPVLDEEPRSKSAETNANRRRTRHRRK